MNSYESIEQLKLPPQVKDRLQELMKRNAQGALTEYEQRELDLLLEANQALSSVRARAQQFREAMHYGKATLGRDRNGMPVMLVPPGTPAIDVEKVRRSLEEEGF